LLSLAQLHAGSAVVELYAALRARAGTESAWADAVSGQRLLYP
jgi:hypothetical protein